MTDRQIARPKSLRSMRRSRPWIELFVFHIDKERHFAGKVHAFNAGLDARKVASTFKIVGQPRCGCLPGARSFRVSPGQVRGGFCTRCCRDRVHATQLRLDERQLRRRGVGGGPACSCFRSACFRDIGGYVPNRLGGNRLDRRHDGAHEGLEDAKFQGQAVPSPPLNGYGRKGWLFRASFDYGVKDYFMGGSPSVAGVPRRLPHDEIARRRIALLSGYTWGTLRRVERARELRS